MIVHSIAFRAKRKDNGGWVYGLTVDVIGNIHDGPGRGREVRADVYS